MGVEGYLISFSLDCVDLGFHSTERKITELKCWSPRGVVVAQAWKDSIEVARECVGFESHEFMKDNIWKYHLIL